MSRIKHHTKTFFALAFLTDPRDTEYSQTGTYWFYFVAGAVFLTLLGVIAVIPPWSDILAHFQAPETVTNTVGNTAVGVFEIVSLGSASILVKYGYVLLTAETTSDGDL